MSTPFYRDKHCHSSKLSFKGIESSFPWVLSFESAYAKTEPTRESKNFLKVREGQKGYTMTFFLIRTRQTTSLHI